MMLSLFVKPLNSSVARVVSFCPAQRNKRSALRLARPFLFALLFTTLLANTVTAIPLARYESSVHEAVVKLKALERWADGETPTQYGARVTATFKDIRNSIPAEETVEWDGGKVHINNSWLEAELQSYEGMSDVQRFFALARITERMQALEDRLSELHGQRKVTGESKDKEKAHLESVLRRDEFAEKQPEEGALARMWRRFLEWWNNLFPRGNGLAPGQTSWLSLIALIAVFGLAAGVLGYAAWKLLPFFERWRRARLKLEKHEPRVILGERLAPDQSAADLLRDAENLARRGELRAAIRKAYIAILLELNERKVITLAQNKTNRDYLRALREKRPLLSEMQRLTNSFENHWYGFQQATAEDWTDFRRGYEKVLSFEFRVSS